MTATTLLSDNGATSGVSGYQLTGGTDGTLQIQTTTSGGTATTALTIDNSQNATFAGNLTVTGTLYGGVPSGTLLMWATSSAPTGYVLCNGAAISRSTYAALFAIIGTTFGTGDGSTTFNVPDFRDRMPVGAGTTYSANSSGGSADAITVSHTHTFSATTSTASLTGSLSQQGNRAGMATSSGVFSSVGNTGYAAVGSTSGVPASFNFDASHSHTLSGTTASAGSSGTGANLPPYRGIYFIIKT